ncbi:hypothetical protein [Streptomyces sp. NPDC056188]|uniref:hypothetical protein n=1 Tax=Streptomyces sp. NPDC056188 TaxID=3345740 RepID=UPI0035D7E31C
MLAKRHDGTHAWKPCANCKKYPNGALAEVCDDCWGVFCRHGIKILAVTPETRGKGVSREGRIVEPWPCPECSQAEFETELDEEAAAYWESQGPHW